MSALRLVPWLALAAACGLLPARAQIDPEPRQLLQLGYNQPLEGRGPLAAYAYFYWNMPDFPRTNQTLRLAIAPVYLDSELGFRALLGEGTDLAFGLAGGGFADTFSEIRRGKFLREESFLGHTAEGSVSLYHRVNPAQMIPLNLVLRGIVHYATYEADDQTAPGFELPENRTALALRAGVRWGGREPLLVPKVAMELSAWYQGEVRNDFGRYGFNDDREMVANSHLFWMRALLSYTLPDSGHHFAVSFTGGTSIQPDRFSAFRLGALLPMASEFPLNLPGYYFQEITARRFALISGQYLLPLDSAKAWNLTMFASSAFVDYLAGFEQPGNWLSGAGGGITYQSPNGVWQVSIGYARGFDAIRNNSRGANMLGFAMQFDLERQRERGRLFDPSRLMDRLRGIERMFSR